MDRRAAPATAACCARKASRRQGPRTRCCDSIRLPMTERLYYDDPYTREFDASITRIEIRDGRPHVWLDRSAFYPTSGGQPFDTGTLGSSLVEQVIEDEHGDVVHVIAGASGATAPEPADAGALRVGAAVHGTI